MFDEEPQDPHYECGLEIHGLKAEIADLREQAICAEMVRRSVETGLVEEIKFLKASIEDYKQQLVKRDSDDAVENQRLRAALERCREMFRQCSRALEGEEQESFEIMEQVCADALEAKR